MLGRALMNNNSIINDISVPQHRDTRSRCFFRKSKSDHQIIVDNYWKASRGYINYLGEWHTHPEKIPKSSSIDLESWMRNLKLNKNEILSHIYIIVGMVEIGVWQGVKESKTIKHIGYFKI